MEAEGNSSPPPPPLPTPPSPPAPRPSAPPCPTPSPDTDTDAASDSAQNDGLNAAAPLSASAPHSDDLREKIVRQVEYYFSDANLPTDTFLLKYIRRDKKGFVPIAVIASFRRMKKLVQDLAVIADALRTSSQLVVSSDGRKVKRLHPLPDIEYKDPKSCTVLVENLPEDYSVAYIQRTFGSIGNIKNVTISDPNSLEESATKPEMTLSMKLHALIEYETAEAAQNAVVSLNDEKNWRSGMRVELLIKRMEKFGLIQKGQKEFLSERKSDGRASNGAIDQQNLKPIDQQEKISERKEEEVLPEDKAGGRSRRYKNRGRGHLQQNSNGQGHGSVSSTSSGLGKPAPGPRMPDGTKGFIMGRGKPLQQS